MDKQTNLRRMIDAGLVAVIRRPKESQVFSIVEALVKGGVKALEVTVDTPSAYRYIEEIKKTYGDQVLVGAGTVLDPVSAKQGLEAGSDFIFSPSLNVETIEVTKSYGKISIPGVLTPTEIVTAYHAGADIVKIFPGSAFGADYIKELRAPLPHIPMMPTGGVNLENVAQFIRNGAVAVGVGSSLLDQQMIASQRYDLLEEHARKFVAEIQKAKGRA